MRRLFIAAVMAAFLFLPAAAFAQGAVLQCGLVSPGHIAIWGRNGCISDGGASIPLLSSVNTWTGLNTFAAGEVVTGGIGTTFQSQIPSSFTSTVTMGSTLSVAGAATMSSGLNLTGALNSATTAGQITGTWGGSPTMAGDWTFLGSVALDGAVTLSPVGNITIGGNLAVSGTTALGGGGSLAGNFSGTPNLTGAVTLSGTPSITNGAALSGTFSGNPTTSGQWTFNNGMTVGASTATPFLVIGSAGATNGTPVSIIGPPGTSRSITFVSNSAGRRFLTGVSNAAESGGNAGSDYIIQRFNDSNALIDTPLTITRSSGLATFADAVTVSGVATLSGGGAFSGTFSGTPTFSGDVTLSGAGTGLTVTNAASIGGALGVTGATTLSGGTLNGSYAGSPSLTGATLAVANATTLSASGVALTVNAQAIFGSTISNPQISIGNAGATGGSFVELQAAAGTGRELQFVSGTALRWLVGTNGDAESGSNAGSNWTQCRYDDSGTLIDCPVQVSRANGLVTLGDGLLALGNGGVVAGDLQFLNTTSGKIHIQPPTGALGNVILTLPDVASTLATLAAQTFTGTQTFADGTAISSSGLTAGKFIKPTLTVVASLPTCNAGAKGQIYEVSDANAPTYGATLTGGSTAFALAACDGTNWTAH